MRTQEKEIKAGKRATVWLLTAYSRASGSNHLRVRDRSGCLALVDSHSRTHTHTLPVSSSLIFTISASQQTHFLFTGETSGNSTLHRKAVFHTTVMRADLKKILN